MKTKKQRLAIVWQRLNALPHCRSFEQMREQLCATLEEVEDEETPFERDPKQLDPIQQFIAADRMYCVQDDNVDDVEGHPLVKRLRSAGEHAFIGANGSLEVRSKKRADGTRAKTPREGVLVFKKAGADGRGVWDL